MHPNVKDLTGKTFGELLVIGPAPRPEGKKGRSVYWECMCTCFKEVVIRSDSLVQGKSTTCGCTNDQTTRMRAAIKPRKSKYDHQPMSDNQTQTSVSIALGDLVALRNDLRNLSSTSRGTRMALTWLTEKINATEIVPLPRYANEQDQPRTVKGETMSEQSARFSGPTTCAVGGAGGFAHPSMGGMFIGGGGGGLASRNMGELAKGVSSSEQHTRLQFKPVLNNLSERKHSHYFKKCPYDAVDVYRVLKLFGVTDPAIAHAVKKLLVAGGRGAGKDITQDVQEAIDTCERWKDMREEDVTAGLELLELMKA
jgi:hypothetical protein